MMWAINAAVTGFALTFTVLATAGGAHANTAVRTIHGQETAVGHQQPAARDLMGATSTEGIGVGTTPELQKKEHALDRELNSEICRGC
jgi:hypothetical protein